MDKQYLALARKYRPKNFKEVVGQKDILAALENSLDTEKLHHAYLLSGTRGVGKTTIARLFAKALNCEQGISSHPCCQCSICKSIDEGSFIDLIEIDAASRTKVEDTRAILENVQYKPAEGRYKVYLIDEVHMLSTGSFNALLKTLEEPPQFVKFVLATTDPQKIPATILSRCMQLKLQPLTIEQISEQLKNVLIKENIAYEEQAILLIADAANGSMRDALSITDQAIALCGEKLTASSILSMLGCLDKKLYVQLLSSIAVHNIAAIYQILDKIASFSPNYLQIIDDLIGLIHDVAMFQFRKEQSIADTSNSEYAIDDLAKVFNQSSVQLYYQILLNSKRDFSFSPSPKLAFDMVVLRLIEFGQVAPQNHNIPSSGIVNTSISSNDRVNSTSQIINSVFAENNTDKINLKSDSTVNSNSGKLNLDGESAENQQFDTHTNNQHNELLAAGKDNSKISQDNEQDIISPKTSSSAASLKAEDLQVDNHNSTVNPIISLEPLVNEKTAETSSNLKNNNHFAEKSSADISDVMSTIFNMADRTASDVPWNDSFKVITLEDLLSGDKREDVSSSNTFSSANASINNVTFLDANNVASEMVSSEPVTLESLKNKGSAMIQNMNYEASEYSNNGNNSLDNNSAFLQISSQNLNGEIAANLESNQTFYANEAEHNSAIESAQESNSDNTEQSSTTVPVESGDQDEIPIPDDIPAPSNLSLDVEDYANYAEASNSSENAPAEHHNRGVWIFHDENEYQPEQALSYVKDPWYILITEKIKDPMLEIIMKSTSAEIVDENNIIIHVDPDTRAMITDNMEKELSTFLQKSVTVKEDVNARAKSPLNQAYGFYEKIKQQQFKKLIESEKIKDVIATFGCKPTIENFHLIKKV